MRAVALSAAALALAAASGPAAAHFQELIPSTDIVTPETGTAVDLAIRFTHPMSGGPHMDMGPPARIAVLAGGTVTDLTAQAKSVTVDGKAAYALSHVLTAPADYVYFIEPAPYWEPAEGKMIVHYTKVVVDAFDAQEGWDALVGLPVEIEPLVRPYGLWTGNVFRGLVRKDGAPVPFAEVEVEWRNDGSVTPPADAFVTQVVKAGPDGVFSYAMPRAGWWGFAALVEAESPMKNPAGEDVPVEHGGLLWVRAVDMK
ncbi:MAG: DUF4198 domain-containing protein [Caenispirillum bisanense]|nr:DUF4198 domain-containing protein [Caenispirillum bisanense]MCA1973871.1 DUF4198 domain-containing protein [Caenispirillum sp.]